MKVQRIYDSTQEINFLSPQTEFSLYHSRFLTTDLGKIYQSLPWLDLVKVFKLKESHKGPPSIFSPQGKLALMFLKSYTELSDKKLIDQLNSNIDYQLFCGIYLGLNQLEDFKIVSRIRTELGKNLDIKKAQQVLASHWKPYLAHTNVMLSDATCYETHMRYPTNVKLLWECVEWMHGQLKLSSKYLKQHTPRTKYLKQKQRYRNYSRKRRKCKKERKVLTRSLLHLLNKLDLLLNELEQDHVDQLVFPAKYYERRKVISTILDQQQQMFETGKSLPGRIVSISKSYIRPIVRGKETKKVEFGAKVNMVQFDGINFIDHISYDPFNEGTRLIPAIRNGRDLMGKITHTSADAIYATNKNRKHCTQNNITTNFTRKGRAGKHEQHRILISKELNRERSTRMEGSFGTEKEYYGLKRIKARIQNNETLWIFFGIHTANAVRMTKKIFEKPNEKIA